MSLGKLTIFVKVRFIILSACAEDRGLCPWMNAQNASKYFTHRSIAASADFTIGGYPFEALALAHPAFAEAASRRQAKRFSAQGRRRV
jgi:hypothetical protein